MGLLLARLVGKGQSHDYSAFLFENRHTSGILLFSPFLRHIDRPAAILFLKTLLEVPTHDYHCLRLFGPSSIINIATKRIFGIPSGIPYTGRSPNLRFVHFRLHLLDHG